MNTIQGTLLSLLEGRKRKEMDANAVEYLYLLPAYNIHSSLSPFTYASRQLLANSYGLNLCNVSCIDQSYSLSFLSL